MNSYKREFVDDGITEPNPKKLNVWNDFIKYYLNFPFTQQTNNQENEKKISELANLQMGSEDQRKDVIYLFYLIQNAKIYIYFNVKLFSL